MVNLKVILLDRDRKHIKDIEIEGKAQIEKVAAASLIQHEGKFYRYHTIGTRFSAQYMECDPPVEV